VGTAPVENAYLIVELAKPWPKKIKAEEALAQLKPLLKGAAEDVKLLATPRIDWLPLCQRPWALLVRWSAGQALVQELSAQPDELRAALASPAAGKPTPLYLVCTHGSRDRCCGTLGYPVYKTLHESGSRKVLQVSHLGGHRYAPVLLALPEWRFFGHLDCDSCLTMDRVLGQGEPYLEGYRGSGRLPAELQPIEARLWEEYGNQLKELRLANGHGTSTLTVSASFQDGTRRSYRARLGVQEQRGFKSCSDMPKGKQKAIELPTLESLLETVE
jgi:hypothetical protein